MRRRHKITGRRRESYEGSAGQTEYRDVDEEPKTVACNVRPLSVDEQSYYGDRAVVRRKVFADTWPFDIHSRLTFDGAEWDVEPEQRFDYGAGTKHVEVVIRRR